MGNKHSHEYENEYEEKKKSKTQEKVQIVPYIDGMPILQSKLQKLIVEKFKDDEFTNNEVIAMKEKKENILDIEDEIKQIERDVFPTMSEHIRAEYETFSFENKMGQHNLLEYFGLQDLENTKLGTRFFMVSKNTLSQEKTGPYLDYSKFLKTLSMLSGQNSDGRLEFLYQMFDMNLDGKIEKDEMRDFLQMTLDALLSVNYEDELMKELSKKIQMEQERTINSTLDQITMDIFANANESTALNFGKWKHWIEEIDGFQDVLTFDPQPSMNSAGGPLARQQAKSSGHMAPHY